MQYTNKRAQMTLFVVVAIIAVAIIAMFFVFRPQITRLTMSEEKAKTLVQSQVADVKDYVESCVETSMRKNVNTMARQGGRILQKGEHFAVPPISDPVPIDYAYFYNKETNQMENDLPTTDEMKYELIEHTVYDADLEKCVSLSPFKRKFNVKTGNLEIISGNMMIGETNGRIVVPIKYPVAISLGDVSVTIDDYTASIPVNLYKVREVAAQVIEAYATGESMTKVQLEYATLQEVELRSNANAEMVFPKATSFDLIPTENEITNTKNNLITITYENPGLESPLDFYFLIGQE